MTFFVDIFLQIVVSVVIPLRIIKAVYKKTGKVRGIIILPFFLLDWLMRSFTAILFLNTMSGFLEWICDLSVFILPIIALFSVGKVCEKEDDDTTDQQLEQHQTLTPQPDTTASITEPRRQKVKVTVKKKRAVPSVEEAKKDAILAEGKAKMTGNAVSEYEAAIKLFASIPGWKNADELIDTCKAKIDELKAQEGLEKERQAEIARKKAEKRAKRKKIITISTISVTSAVCVILAAIILLNTVIIPSIKYNDAIALMDAGKYEEAITAFKTIEGYKDSAIKIKDCKYKAAVALMDAGKYVEAAIAFNALDEYKDSKTQCMALWARITARDAISAGSSHTVGLRCDGAVVAVGSNSHGQCNVSNWTDIIAISAGDYHTVGLRSNGTVVAVSSNIIYETWTMLWWNDIVAISAGSSHTVGLRSDGTVIAAGSNSYGQCNVAGWTNIVAISAGGLQTVGLKADGTVVAVGFNDYGQCDVSGWTDIVAISAGQGYTVGLKSDGTVVTTKYTSIWGDYGQCDVADWTDIVAISAGYNHTVGLKSDGTVVATGRNILRQCDVSNWTDIVAISAGRGYTVGLKSDGTIVTVGANDTRQCDVSSWTDIKTD